MAIVILMGIAGSFYSKSFDGDRLRMPDIEHYIATAKEVNDHRERTGEQALWTDSQFGGMPTFQLGMKTSDINAGSWLGRWLRMGFPWACTLMAFLLLLHITVRNCTDRPNPDRPE